MIIYRSLDEIQDIGKTAVALGNFDGIHRGHQVLINEAVATAKARGVKSAVFTFANHPRNVMSGKRLVKNIIYEKEKIEIIEAMGVDYLFNIDFDETIMKQTPDEFIKDILIDGFNVDTAICGFNYTYGHKAAGTSETLVAAAKELGFDVRVMDAVTLDGQVVSSTLIRECISEGYVSEAGVLLGRPYSIKGIIVKGNQLGRTIGFPTCNIIIDEAMVTPTNGVYVTRAVLDGQVYRGLTNVGNKPTVGVYGKNIETYIFDFDRDVYGEEIKVDFLEKLRDEKKFDGLDALKEQIEKDRRAAYAFHEKGC